MYVVADVYGPLIASFQNSFFLSLNCGNSFLNLLACLVCMFFMTNFNHLYGFLTGAKKEIEFGTVF